MCVSRVNVTFESCVKTSVSRRTRGLQPSPPVDAKHLVQGEGLHRRIKGVIALSRRPRLREAGSRRGSRAAAVERVGGVAGRRGTRLRARQGQRRGRHRQSRGTGRTRGAAGLGRGTGHASCPAPGISPRTAAPLPEERRGARRRAGSPCPSPSPAPRAGRRRPDQAGRGSPRPAGQGAGTVSLPRGLPPPTSGGDQGAHTRP